MTKLAPGNTILISMQANLITRPIAFINILRALTMVLMIFVNDLWTIKEGFTCMRHVKPGVVGICYLVPYYLYVYIKLPDNNLPLGILTGAAGMFQSFIFALLCVWITAGLIRVGSF